MVIWHFNINYNSNCGSGGGNDNSVHYHIDSEISKYYGCFSAEMWPTDAAIMTEVLGEHPSYNGTTYQDGDTVYLNGVFWSGTQQQSHNVCQASVCTQVQGAGQNECVTIGQACPQTQQTSNSILIIIIIILVYLIFERFT